MDSMLLYRQKMGLTSAVGLDLHRQDLAHGAEMQQC